MGGCGASLNEGLQEKHQQTGDSTGLDVPQPARVRGRLKRLLGTLLCSNVWQC